MYLCEISAMDSRALTQFEVETVQMMKKTYKVSPQIYKSTVNLNLL